MSLQDLLMNSLNAQGEPDLRSTLQYFVNSGAGSTGILRDPFVDIVDTDDEVIVYVELPGVSENDISVDFFNNKITVVGRKNKPYDIAPLKKEITYGEFKRLITIPISVTKQVNVKVEYVSGILKILIDKKSEAENRFSLTLGNSHQSSSSSSVNE